MGASPMNMKIKLNAGSMANQCSACGQLFRAVTTHTAHRTGRFGFDRRCMSPDEMLAFGLKLNVRGQWIKVDEEALDRLHQYFADDELEETELR
jgi:hypothetical protein